MSDKKVAIGMIIFTILLLGGSVMVLGNTSQSKKITYSQTAKVEAIETLFNFGNIDYNGQKATKTFTIQNVGSSVLQLSKVKTSCTCTTAQVIIDGTVSPIFSMHGASDWLGEVQPGKEAELVVVFDQAFHGPSGVGAIERFITLETNDLSNKKLEFKLKGNVVNK